MTLTVSVQQDRSSATYEVKHETNDIYKATLLGKGFRIFHPFPEKIVLIKSDGSWTSDCPIKVTGLQIGQKSVNRKVHLTFLP